MRLKFLVLLPIFLFVFAGGPAKAQMDIITGAVIASSMFSNESSGAGMYMKVYVDVELGKKIDNLEIRRATLHWSKHASIQEEFQWVVRKEKYACRLVAAVHNLDNNNLTFYYIRVE